MTWSFSIGRLFGSELRVHATFFLLLIWIGAATYMVGGLPAAIYNVLLVLAVFACVVAHEFGHALMARRYGIATPDITLLPIGGLARLERMPEKPMQEVAVALAGPAVNVVIWFVLVVVFGAETRPDKLARLDDPALDFVGRLALINIFLALFNMLPAFPMDGGRVTRALLSIRMGRVRATRIAAFLGQGMAFLFGLVGLLVLNPFLILIAVFIFIAASSESADVAMRDAARAAGVRDAMITAFESLRPDSTLHDAATALIRTTQHEFPVIDGRGHLAGFLTRRALFAALAEGMPRATRVSEVMQTGMPTVVIKARLEAALDAMHRAGAPAVGVTDLSGHFIGYITPENVGEMMVVMGRSDAS